MPASRSPVLERPRALAVAGLVLVAALIGMLAAPHRAQAVFDGPAYAFPVPDYVSGLIGASALDNAYRAGGGSGSGKGRKQARRPAPPKRSTAAQRRTLRFVPTRAVTDRIHATVVVRTGQDPATILPLFDATVTDWRRVMKQVVGWSPRDLGDTAAFAFVQQYRLYYGRSTFDEKGVARLRASVRDNLGLQRGVRRLSAARKQEASEMLELRTIFFAANLESAATTGDTALRERIRRELRTFTRETFGVDLTKVRLTSKGLVGR